MAVLPPDPVQSLRCLEMGPVHSICFHHDQRLLAGTVKGSIYVFDLQTNRSLLHFEVGKQPITSLHHTADILIAQEKGGKIFIWTVAKSGYVLKRTIESNYMGFCRTALLGDVNDANYQQMLFHPVGENSVGVLRLADIDAPPQTLVPDDPQLPKLGIITCFKPFECASQIFLLAGYESGFFLTWDLSSGVVVDLLQLEADPTAVDYDPQKNRGIIAGPTDKLTIFSYERQAMRMKWNSCITIRNAGINCIRIRPDQKVFSTAGWDGRIRIYSWNSMRLLAVLTEHKSGTIMDIAYSNAKVSMWNAPIMAAAGTDGQISLWDLYN